MDPVLARTNVQCASAERIVESAGHVTGQDATVGSFPGDHCWRRSPLGTLGLSRDRVCARPLKSLAAHTDPVLDRLTFPVDVIETALVGVDDDRAGAIRASVIDEFARHRRHTTVIEAEAAALGVVRDPLLQDRIIIRPHYGLC